MIRIGSSLKANETVNAQTVRPMYGITNPLSSEPEFFVTHAQVSRIGLQLRVNFSKTLFQEEHLEVLSSVQSNFVFDRIGAANPGYLVESTPDEDSDEPNPEEEEDQPSAPEQPSPPDEFLRSVKNFIESRDEDGNFPFPVFVPSSTQSPAPRLQARIDRVCCLMQRVHDYDDLYILSEILIGFTSKSSLLSCTENLQAMENRLAGKLR